ncbi:MAG: ABC transporter substrate-binding protein [Promethearchaeota archaeon]
MNLERKDIYIIALSLCLVITSGINIGLLVSSIQLGYHHLAPPELETLVVGTGSGPNDLDPTDSWDSASNDVIEQVVETLFTYDTRQYVIDETMPRINWLASSYAWSGGNTILTVDIRTGITFHDGTPMDAAAVAWNFNRFMYLMNHTGELPSDGRAVKVHSLYEFPDGTPVFSSIVATDVDTVVFTLTAPYAPILEAMCYISCGILSPSSTPEYSIIDLTGDIVGTGPYMYDYYITDTEVRFTTFEDYWGGVPLGGGTPVAVPIMFDAMLYRVIDDPTSLNYAMLAGDIDILFGALDDLLPAFRTNPWIDVYEAEQPGLIYQYLCFNTQQINVTWRKAMSYAINYTYIIEDMLEGRAFRAYGAISPSFGAGFNHWLRDSLGSTDNGTAIYNLTIARQTILDGLAGDSRITGLTANSNPDDPAWEAIELGTFNYSYDIENWFRSNLFEVLKDWFDSIGIDLQGNIIDQNYFILIWRGLIPGGYDRLQIFFSRADSYIYTSGGGWYYYVPPTVRAPDYLDSFNILDPLYSNISVSNACQVNDPLIQSYLSLALQTTDDNARDQIYKDIQWRLFAELYVHAPVYHNMVKTVHAADLYHMGYNVMGRWWALPVKRNLTWIPEI